MDTSRQQLNHFYHYTETYLKILSTYEISAHWVTYKAKAYPVHVKAKHPVCNY